MLKHFTSGEQVMFLVLAVRVQDNSRRYERILTKFFEGFGKAQE